MSTRTSPDVDDVGGPRRARINPTTAAAFVVAALIFVGAAVFSPGFAGLHNIQQLLVFASFLGIAALGETLVILAGGLDLSVPWMITFGGIELTKLAADHVAGGLDIVILLVAGGAVGLVNGIGVTYFRIPPIVMTLATGGLVEGYLLAVGTLETTNLGVPGIARSVASGKVGPVPTLVVVWAVLAVMTAVFLRRFPLGRHIYAVGANPTASRLAGISVARVTVFTYVVAGCCSVLAGLILAGYLNTSYLDMGNPYLFGSIAAVALGGTAISGGRGSYWGTVGGALTLTLLTAVLPLLHLNTADLEILYGVVVLVGVVVSRALTNRGAPS